MNIFRDPCPFGRMEGYNDEEAQAFDILLHLFQPDLIVETGTSGGSSARFFAKHCPVVTFDSENHEIGTSTHPMTKVLGRSPEQLDRILEVVDLSGKRWMFSHDSEHTKDVVVAEIEWAFAHGALAAICHDAAHHLKDATQSMQAGFAELRRRGRYALRLCDLGVPEGCCLTGVGFFLPR